MISHYPKEIQTLGIENLYDSACWRFYIYNFNTKECLCKRLGNKDLIANISPLSMDIQLTEIKSTMDTIELSLSYRLDDTTFCWPMSEYFFPKFVGTKKKQRIEYMILDGARFNNGLHIDQIFKDSANNSDIIKELNKRNLYPIKKQEEYFLNYIKNTDIQINEWLKKEIDKKTHQK
jgi:hypothetical protein